MMPKLAYIDLAAFKHLVRGLTFDTDRITEVMDEVLVTLNKQTGLPDCMRTWIENGAGAHGPCPLDPEGRVIVDIVQTTIEKGEQLHLATLLRKVDERHMAPVVFVRMHSPLLDIPMRVELPLRAVMMGNPPLAGTYTVYLHALMTDRGETYTYYGITKRGWGLRFHEHTRAAVAQKSQRLLARTFNALIEARADELYGLPDDRPRLAGIVTAVLGTGMSREAALDAEEGLIDTYSLASKHPYGLNMIPGGLAGLKRARRFVRNADPIAPHGSQS